MGFNPTSQPSRLKSYYSAQLIENEWGFWWGFSFHWPFIGALGLALHLAKSLLRGTRCKGLAASASSSGG